jgi:putative aldouronate transport system permease protein
MQSSSLQTISAVPRKRKLTDVLYNQRYLFLMSVPFIVWIFIFCFGPISGWLMAFQDFNPNKGLFGSPWVGFKHFAMLFESKQMLLIFRNTVVISLLGIIAGNFCPLILALLLNEVNNMPLKRAIQTISYLPHFVSFVVVANIFLSLFSVDGVVNSVLMNLGIVKSPTQVWADKNSFWGMVTSVNIWKEIGWGSIIYLATIASVDVEIYEAAIIDGCGRFKRMLYITVPSIMPVAMLLWILSMGDIFNAGFDASYLLGNPVTRDTSEVIDTYIFRVGIQNGMYSFSTAATLFKTFIGVVMVVITNQIARRHTEYSLW